MRAIKTWRKKPTPRNRIKTAFRRLAKHPETPRRLSRIAATLAHWLVEHHIGGRAGKSLLALFATHAPGAATPKALSFSLRSIRRLWGSTLSIGIRLKW